MRRLAAAGLAACSILLPACGEDEPAPRRATPPQSTTISLRLGEGTTLRGPDGVQLRVSLDLTSQPPVPLSLSAEQGTFLEVHLSVANTGDRPFSGVVADAADLAVVPSGTVAPIPADTVPTEIALTAGIDLTEPIELPPGGEPTRGKVVFQIGPDDEPSSFSLSLPGGFETAEWAL